MHCLEGNPVRLQFIFSPLSFPIPHPSFLVFNLFCEPRVVGLTRIDLLLYGAISFRTDLSCFSRSAIMVSRSVVSKFAKALLNLVDISSVSIPLNLRYVHSLTSRGCLSTVRCDTTLI